MGVFLGLLLGKPIGIVLFCLASAKVGFSALPVGMRAPHLIVVGMVGGIGFTMDIFVAQLAFPSGPMLETAKLAVLCGSGAAAVLGLAVGWKVLQPRGADALGAKTESEAEASDTL